jgi:outer membrane protein OmpA-like peptidoglycan-associated protein
MPMRWIAYGAFWGIAAGCGGAAVEPRPPSPDPETAAAAEPGEPAGPPAALGEPPALADADARFLIDAGDIAFASGTHALTSSGEAAAAAAAAEIAGHPEWRLVMIAVHTDPRGSEEHNLTLSRRRAGALRARMLDAGIAEERVVAVGFGEACAAGGRPGPAAWAASRHVDLVVLETDEGCTGMPIGCLAAVEAGLTPRTLDAYLPGAATCPPPPP